MITLFEQDIKTTDRQSSKGNQLKWIRENVWYKADYTGYEGLSEYMISNLLKKSSLKTEEYVLYDTEEIVDITCSVALDGAIIAVWGISAVGSAQHSHC